MGEDLPEHTKFWLTEAKHDCFFNVGLESGPTERIGAVRIILMGHSEPLRTMLGDNQLAEQGEVRLIDVEPETFWNFLKCLYGGCDVIIPKLTFEASATLLYIADKYLVSNDIRNRICDHLSALLSPDNFLLALSHPVCLQEQYLEEVMLTFLKHYFKTLIQDDKFLDLSSDQVRWMIQQNCLSVREIDIWNAILKWAEHKTESTDGVVLRSQIFQLLEYIRFLTMGYSEFWIYVVASDILLKEEVYDICMSFSRKCIPSIEHICKNKNHRYDLLPASGKIHVNVIGNSKYALFHCLVRDIDDINKYEHSEPLHWAGYVWGITFYNTEDVLCVYLRCCGETGDWSFPTAVDLIFINQDQKYNFSRSYTHTFCESRKRHCCVLHNWDSLIDPIMGFVKDNSCIIRVQITLGSL